MDYVYSWAFFSNVDFISVKKIQIHSVILFGY